MAAALQHQTAALGARIPTASACDVRRNTASRTGNSDAVISHPAWTRFSVRSDFVWIGGPGEGLGFSVVIFKEAVNGGLQVNDRAEDTALQPSLGQFGEEAFDGIEPGARGRREVEGETLV